MNDNEFINKFIDVIMNTKKANKADFDKFTNVQKISEDGETIDVDSIYNDIYSRLESTVNDLNAGLEKKSITLEVKDIPANLLEYVSNRIEGWDQYENEFYGPHHGGCTHLNSISLYYTKDVIARNLIDTYFYYHFNEARKGSYSLPKIKNKVQKLKIGNYYSVNTNNCSSNYSKSEIFRLRGVTLPYHKDMNISHFYLEANFCNPYKQDMHRRICLNSVLVNNAISGDISSFVTAKDRYNTRPNFDKLPLDFHKAVECSTGGAFYLNRLSNLAPGIYHGYLDLEFVATIDSTKFQKKLKNIKSLPIISFFSENYSDSNKIATASITDFDLLHVLTKRQKVYEELQKFDAVIAKFANKAKND